MQRTQARALHMRLCASAPVCRSRCPCCCAQARGLGYASAAVQAQLAAAPLMQRLELASVKVLRARGTLAPRIDVASGAGGTCHGVLGFRDLPHAVALHILSFVPADARARAALVCRALRIIVADPRLWTVLDLSPDSGVVQPVTDATLRGAAALARGGLTALCLDDCYQLSHEARLEVVRANADSLRKLSCVTVSVAAYGRSSADVQELAGAAPQLVAFKVGVKASVAESTRVLRNEAPFGVLQLRELCIHGTNINQGQAPLDEAELLAFCSAVSAHESLEVLEVNFTPLRTPAVMDALFAAALACKLLVLQISACELSSASVPALARLIRGGVIESLQIDNSEDPLFDEAPAVQLADALAASRTLMHLKLESILLWDNAPAAAVVMRALTGHPTLQEVDLCWNNPPVQFAAGAALGALVAANAPALTSLAVAFSALGDVGLSGLCYALPRNTHLRELMLNQTGMSAAFAGHTLLPAVQANTSLRMVAASGAWEVELQGEVPPELLEVEALVAARNNGDA